MTESSSQFVVSVVGSQYRCVLQVATATLVSERRRHRCDMFQASFWRSPMSPNLPPLDLSDLRPQAQSRPSTGMYGLTGRY